MDDEQRPSRRSAPARSEIVVAGLLFLLGALVIVDSVRLGARWARRRTAGRLLPVLHRAADLLLDRGRDLPRGRRQGESGQDLRHARRAQAGAVDARAVDRLRGADQAARHLRGLDALHRVLHAAAGQLSVAADRRWSRSASAWCSSCCSRCGSRCRCRRGRSKRGSSSTERRASDAVARGDVGRDQLADAGVRRRADAVQPDADVRRRRARRDHRRAAGARRRQRRRDPAAAHVHDAADLGDHHALVHLLGGALRRRDHVDPVQHSRRAVVGGDDLRRLSAGAEGARRRRAHRRVHVVVHRRAGRGDRDHVPLADRRELRARSSGRRSSSRSICSRSAPSSA